MTLKMTYLVDILPHSEAVLVFLSMRELAARGYLLEWVSLFRN